MKRLISPLLFAAFVLTLPAVAQTPPTQGWPANRPPDPSAPQAKPAQAAQPPHASAPAAPGAAQSQQATGTPAPVPLPHWFAEIDVEKKGEITRAEFLKYRMKSFEELDANKDGKLSLEEFLKIAEPPFSGDVPGGPTLEERRNRAKAEFQNLDTNRDALIERGEAEAVVHSQLHQHDTDPANHGTE